MEFLNYLDRQELKINYFQKMKNSTKTPFLNESDRLFKLAMMAKINTMARNFQPPYFGGPPMGFWRMPEISRNLLEASLDAAMLNSMPSPPLEMSGLRGNLSLKENKEKSKDKTVLMPTRSEVDLTMRVQRMLNYKPYPNPGASGVKSQSNYAKHLKTPEKEIEIVDDDECCEIMPSKKVKKTRTTYRRAQRPRHLRNSAKRVIVLDANINGDKDDVISLDSEMSIQEISLIPNSSAQCDESKIKINDIPVGSNLLHKTTEITTNKGTVVNKRTVEGGKEENKKKESGKSIEDPIEIEPKFLYTYEVSIYKYNRLLDIDPTTL